MTTEDIKQTIQMLNDIDALGYTWDESIGTYRSNWIQCWDLRVEEINHLKWVLDGEQYEKDEYLETLTNVVMETVGMLRSKKTLLTILGNQKRSKSIKTNPNQLLLKKHVDNDFNNTQALLKNLLSY